MHQDSLRYLRDQLLQLKGEIETLQTRQSTLSQFNQRVYRKMIRTRDQPDTERAMFLKRTNRILNRMERILNYRILRIVRTYNDLAIHFRMEVENNGSDISESDS